MRIPAAVLLTLCSCLPAFAGDERLLPPYPGSSETRNEAVEYESFAVPLGPTKDGKLTKSRSLEGKRTALEYRTQEGRTPLEVYRNYEAALKKAGFQPLFACRGGSLQVQGLPECGGEIGDAGGFGYWPSGENLYLAARKVHEGAEIWVALDVSGPYQKIFVLRPKPMEMDKVTVDAAALKNTIETEGHAAVYGILFDTNKADLKPASAAALTEISKLLKASPALSIYVVGHTDGVGGLESNLDLSRRRAESVVKELVERYGVAAKRLSPQGVGPLVPLSSNGDEPGRAKNRRVDLVKK